MSFKTLFGRFASTPKKGRCEGQVKGLITPQLPVIKGFAFSPARRKLEHYRSPW